MVSLLSSVRVGENMKWITAANGNQLPVYGYIQQDAIPFDCLLVIVDRFIWMQFAIKVGAHLVSGAVRVITTTVVESQTKVCRHFQ